MEEYIQKDCDASGKYSQKMWTHLGGLHCIYFPFV